MRALQIISTAKFMTSPSGKDYAMIELAAFEELREEVSQLLFEHEQLINVINMHQDEDRILEDFRAAIKDE